VTTNSPSQTNEHNTDKQRIIPNCRIGNFGSACQLDGNSMCFKLKRAIDADKAIVANATNKVNSPKRLMKPTRLMKPRPMKPTRLL
jgi:hypothetical protein